MSELDFGLLGAAYTATGAFEQTSDVAVVRAMLEVEVCLAHAQADVGMIPGASARAIDVAVAGFEPDRIALAEGVRDTANPVVRLVELLRAQVAASDPTAADDVHLGSTSQDILDTAFMMLASRVLADVSLDLGRCIRALVVLIDRHGDVPAVARTLTQHAVPTTVGVRLAGWLQLVLDAVDRVLRVRASLPVSLGGAAGTLSAYVECARARPGDERAVAGVITAFAHHTGLRADGVPWHALRTPYLDLVHALAAVTGGLGKVAADVLVLSRPEVGEVVEPAAPGRGQSSAMPQKRNPVLATLIATAARQLPAQAMLIMQSMACEDERSAGAWHAEWQPLRESLRLSAGAASNAAVLLEGLTFVEERVRENLATGGVAVVAERLTAVLAEDVPKADAKRIVGRAVGEASDGPGVLARIAELVGHHEIGLLRRDAAELIAPAGYLGRAPQIVTEVVARVPEVLDALGRAVGTAQREPLGDSAALR